MRGRRQPWAKYRDCTNYFAAQPGFPVVGEIACQQQVAILHLTPRRLAGMDKMSLHETYLGPVGQPVPTVNPDELKRVLESPEIEAAWTGQAAIGLDTFESFCGPFSNRNAVCYRAMLLRVLRYLAKNASKISASVKDAKDWETMNIIERWCSKPTEPSYFAMSKVALTWPDIGDRDGLPLDMDEFEHLCEAA